jgi:hypothetical protein
VAAGCPKIEEVELCSLFIVNRHPCVTILAKTVIVNIGCFAVRYDVQSCEPTLLANASFLPKFFPAEGDVEKSTSTREYQTV